MRSSVRVCALLFSSGLWLAAPVPILAQDALNDAVARSCPHVAVWREQQRKPDVAAKGDALEPTDPNLRDELNAMAEEDQAARKNHAQDFKTAYETMRKVDVKNTPRIKEIVAKFGFPTKAMVGEDGVESAWLLVQHAAADPAFQARVLTDIAPRVKSGEIRGEQFALLTDRVRVLHEHKPQLYGSQFDLANGKALPRPIEDAAHVDRRRASLDMMPLADYLCLSAVLYSQTSK